jgi:hypothetical protein
VVSEAGIVIQSIDEKLAAIRAAENCINSCLSVNPRAVDMKVFVALNELKMDLYDAKDQQSEINCF